ncbi:MAG: hypothetical protein HY081_02385 [Gammaproteobacteria bacterium]|nr:hypothetical protein [Gammaproteobacteria bacterium]
MQEQRIEPNRKKGHLTFRITAALFILSAVFEIISIDTETILFGAIRTGTIVIVYHLFYIVLFAALGFGIWHAKKWGYNLVFVATAVYTLDKIQFLLNQQAIETLFAQATAGYESALQAQGITAALFMQSIALMTVVVIVCWWGFAWYTYWRRDYFK